jgi:hypothetical protein
MESKQCSRPPSGNVTDDADLHNGERNNVWAFFSLASTIATEAKRD